MTDQGFTHIALPCSNLEETIAFYQEYADFECVHQRVDNNVRVAWLSDKTRPFIIVFLETNKIGTPLGPLAHLGVGVKSKDEVDRLANKARAAGIEVSGPKDYGHPAGYLTFLHDPDGHTLELSYGQEVEVAVGQN